jgi:sterol desaturase/sphingolipid hydroxylase (fatty acid hydroxylase superfamily)
MLSLKSAYQYTFTNSIVMTFAYLHYSAGVYLLPYLIFRNFAMVYLIDYATMGRIMYMSPTGQYERHVVQSASAEYLALSLLPTLQPSHGLNLVTFIPLSFAFEILYDFFFYWGHRISHRLGSSWHKKHHEHVHLMPILAFHNDLLDDLLYNIVLLILTQRLIHVIYPMSALEIAMIMTYKVFIEIAGHISCSSGRLCSFPQYIWLPRYLGIELYADDHAMHHANTRYNFSKRFALWDQVFGTAYIKKKSAE